MAETVYVLGAGINRSIRDNRGLKPPLATDLFKQALRHEMLDDKGINELSELFEYIERYWKLSVKDLREDPLNLEDCFTLLQQQRQDLGDKYVPGNARLGLIEDQLASLLTKFLSFTDSLALDLMALGKKVLEERAAVLSFNYDTIIESAIEYAAGDSDETSPQGRKVAHQHLSYSKSKWNRALAYGVQFDEVELQQVGSVLDPVPRERFYGHPDNTLYDPPILKLHGSLNWFVHTSRRSHPDRYQQSDNPKKGQVVLTSGYPLIRDGFKFGVPDRDGWLLRPLIVTPVLYKDLRDGLVGESWRRAREELSGCRRLVVAGYSFPPTDFAMHRLFLEAFVDGPPDELISINPDSSVAGQVARLCNFEGKPLARENLQEFFDRLED